MMGRTVALWCCSMMLASAPVAADNDLPNAVVLSAVTGDDAVTIGATIKIRMHVAPGSSDGVVWASVKGPYPSVSLSRLDDENFVARASAATTEQAVTAIEKPSSDTLEFDWIETIPPRQRYDLYFAAPERPFLSAELTSFYNADKLVREPEFRTLNGARLLRAASASEGLGLGIGNVAYADGAAKSVSVDQPMLVGLAEDECLLECYYTVRRPNRPVEWAPEETIVFGTPWALRTTLTPCGFDCPWYYYAPAGQWSFTWSGRFAAHGDYGFGLAAEPIAIALLPLARYPFSWS